MATDVQRVKLTAPLVESFAGMFLSPMYDNAKPTPEFHREGWRMYCTDDPQVALAAPRGHAKSTALTHDYALAVALFREQDYIVIVSNTEELAIGHLGDIARVLRENDDVRGAFGIAELETDNKADVVVRFQDKHRCRFVAKGSGQGMRGIKWDGKRPGLIICDDLEDDDQTANKDRRESFRRWFNRELLPTMRVGGVVRLHGTIVHEDALLSRLMKNPSWVSRLYKAHDSFDDYSGILWPEQFTEGTLRAIRQRYIDDGDAAGYSQEYLNDPRDNSEAYLRKDDFMPMNEKDHSEQKMIVVGCDFAVSKADKANRTSFTVGGKCVRNLLHYVDQYKGRWDTLQWIDVMFDIQQKWRPAVFFVEDGVIWKSIAPTIYKEMQVRDIWLNCQPINPTKDKATRGRPFQKRMRAGGCRFNKDADWYPSFEDELLHFTGYSEATLDDQFDSAALVAKGVESMAELDADDFMNDDEIELIRSDPRKTTGRNEVTGY